MAIGENSSNNSNKVYENTYYSRLRFKAEDGKLSINFSFRSGLLVIDLCALQDGFKYEPIQTIYLSPTKARLLADEIEKFKVYLASDNVEPNIAYGVNAGMGEKISYIGFHTNTLKEIFITIGKINGDTGSIIGCDTIKLNKDYHFSLEWNDISSMDLMKVYNNDIELEQFIDMLRDFARSMNGAMGYGVADITRYDLNRILRKMDPIYDKLGIERRNSNNGSYGLKSSNFLANAGSTNSNYTTIDDVENILD